MMPSNPETATDLSFNRHTKEWLEKTVSATFDEFLIEITSKLKLHPTEQHNRENSLLNHPLSKIYDLINPYHAFCKLCEQHFYSHSLANDVNSFFQKHINTSYHRQMRTLSLLPNDAPMFTWEEKFHSGRCNVCDMSGLNSYVLDTKFDPLELMKLHLCVWDYQNRENNEKVLKKLHLLKKFCGLTVFRKIYIKTVNGKEVCLLCGLYLPWAGEKAGCHLVSDLHYQKFCVLLKKSFNFAPKDALNGFNLEFIIRWLISYGPLVLNEFVDYDERKICFEDSNKDEDLYLDEQDNFSYCPKNVEKLLKTEEMDFIHKKECLLCSVPFLPGHMNSKLHQIKVKYLTENSFDTVEKYLMYCRKREKRLQIIKNYRNLKAGVEKPPAAVWSKKKVKNAKQKASFQVNFLKGLLKEKLLRVSATFIAANEKEIFCQVCDKYLFKNQKVIHLNSMHHKSEEIKWEQLKSHFKNEKFIEPFQKIQNELVCLLCGAVFNTNTFLSHIKGDMHMRKFVWYCNLNDSVPISSALVIGADFSCCCTICNVVLGKSVPFLSLKIALKNVKLHWPCPKIKEKKEEITQESVVIDEKKKELIDRNQNEVQKDSATCLTCGKTFEESEMKSHNISCTKDMIDFKKMEKTMENIIKIFRTKIINKAFYKSAYLISSLDNSKVITEKVKEILKRERQPLGCSQTSNCLCPDGPSKGERKEEVDDLRIYSNVNNIKEQKNGKSTSIGNKEESTSKEKKGEPTSKEQKYEPTSTEENKNESTKKQEQKESTSKEKKEETTSKGNKEEFTSKEKKEETTSKGNKEESTSKEQKGEPTSKEQKYEPTSTEENKNESTKKQEQKESTSKEKKEETTSKEEQKDSTSKEKKGEPTSKEEQKCKPTSTEENKNESTKKQEQKESTSKEKKEETTSKGNKEESTSKEKKEEPTSKEEQKDSTSKEKKGEPTSKEEQKCKLTSTEEKKNESTNKEKKGESTRKAEREKTEETHEVLIVEGLPKGKKRLKGIYSKFCTFGKIRYIFFEARKAVLAYAEPGVAETVAKGPSIFVNDQKLSLKVSTRKGNPQAGKKLPLLNKDVVYLLKEPQKLMDFVLNLIILSVRALDSPVERRKEELVCSTIISAIFECFPHGRCYPFGSRLSGLTLNNSDLDVFLDCGGMYEGFKNTTPSSERKLVNKVAKLLKKKREITEIIVVDRARVPIVSFLHLPTDTRCDLSFKNGLGVHNTLLLKFMLSLDWRVKPLILFLKCWTKVNGLHGPPYFSSYAIAMLVIYYLEQLESPVLPTIEYLQNNYVGRRTTIGGWDCSINTNKLSLPKLDNGDPLPQLLLGLFEFYAGFDYNANVISPLTGKPLPRETFSNAGFPKLPMCYKRQILNIPTPLENLVHSDILICVMDPFDLSHILTKSFTIQGLQMFINFCEKSKQHLKNGLRFLN